MRHPHLPPPPPPPPVPRTCLQSRKTVAALQRALVRAKGEGGEDTERHGKTHTLSPSTNTPVETRKKTTPQMLTHTQTAALTRAQTHTHTQIEKEKERGGVLLTVFSLEVWNELLVIVGNLS